MVDLTPVQWVGKLAAKHEDGLEELRKLNRHYDLEQPLSYMHPELWLEVSDRIKPVLIAWPQVVVDAVEERLDIEGFRFDQEADDDDRLWDWWQTNNLDEGSSQLHVDALVNGRSFVIVGPDAADKTLPRITVESPLQVFADFDPQTRRVRAALKSWVDDDNTQHATLYLPDGTYRYVKNGNGAYVLEDEDKHGLGVVPVVPFINRGRILKLQNQGRIAPPGRSELSPVLPLSDAACKIATDMMVAAETVAIPSRYVFGVSQDDFVDPDGNDVSPWQTVLGKLMTHEDGDIKAGQWPQGDLTNFHNTLNQLAKIVAAVAALPPHYLGFSTDNPASADGIRSSEARLIKRCERKQVSFGESWEKVMSLAERIVDGEWNANARRLETRWRDAATPTIGQKTDAVTKTVIAGIIPREQAWEDLGYTEGQKKRMREWFDQQAERVMGGDLASLVAGPKPQPGAEGEPAAQA